MPYAPECCTKAPIMIVENSLESIERWLHTPTAADRLFGLWPVLAGTTTATPAYRNSGRVIPYYNLHLIMRGTLYWSSERMPAEVILGPGDAFCLFPEVVHHYRAMPSDPPRMVFLGFDGPAASDTTELLGLAPENPVLRGLPVKRFLPHVRLLPTNFGRHDDQRLLRPTEFLVRFLGELITGAGAAPNRSGRGSVLERARILIDTHCTEDIGVEDIADNVGLSRSYFSKAFAREFSITPREYLWNKRLDQARELLTRTTLSITEIALSVGYADLYTFSHSYRRRFGHAPSRERQDR